MRLNSPRTLAHPRQTAASLPVWKALRRGLSTARKFSQPALALHCWRAVSRLCSRGASGVAALCGRGTTTMKTKCGFLLGMALGSMQIFAGELAQGGELAVTYQINPAHDGHTDRKSTRLNSSH